MSKFYIQSGYQGKEVSAIAFNFDRADLKYSKVDKYDGEIPIGSVEFVEEILGYNPRPDYYPDFLDDHLHREVWYSDSLCGLEDEDCAFIKPADRHKRFDARIVSGFDKYEPCFRAYQTGPYWFSDIVYFKEEWRYYVAEGNIFYAGWYFGEEKEIDPPKLDIDWPKDFCGAVDFGRLSNGKLALVENNLPYACGFYGPYSDGIIYAEWLEKGWEYMKKFKNND